MQCMQLLSTILNSVTRQQVHLQPWRSWLQSIKNFYFFS